MEKDSAAARAASGLMTVREVAEELRVSRAAAYRLIAGGHLGAIRVGHSYRIPESEFAAYKKRAATTEEG
ncbi:helix-turn-helix domain-containing protein [Streptomyces paludis]|uniref:DNA-binding protein n=1 Tax=Streptomyces paludis TaxID=2282738 RepID=A0A345HWP8_9ACTN|nr:helix-turn-helix domain-containing protein [Streptomyces paludis]AXG81122.1 DNA-binding protein [Streptomyces paludis]